MRSIIILGATGSIGSTCINAIIGKKLDFQVKGLVSFSDPGIIALARTFSCPYLLMNGKKDGELLEFLKENRADIVLNGIAGSAGLKASLDVISLNMDLALANKESIVLGGSFLFSEAARNGVRIIPVDSEHSCLYNLLRAFPDARELVITASGGPFYNRSNTDDVTIGEALNHPTWKMGRKITIDSATLANKGLEVIEAGFLFGFPAGRIRVTVHRQSVVHSLVKVSSGAYYAQLTPPDMTLPIISALSDGKVSLDDIVEPLDFTNLDLTFRSWDKKQFPLLDAAYMCLERKQGWPIAFNMANEVAVNAFLDGRIPYNRIADIVLDVLDGNWASEASSLAEIEQMMAAAKELACKGLARCSCI